MGFKVEFNWALKLKPEQGFPENLEEGKEYEFFKKENRVYPIGIPIDLVDKDWNAVAKAVVLEFTNKENETAGKFRVLRILDEDEKKVLTNSIREKVSYFKGGIKEFNNVKMT